MRVLVVDDEAQIRRFLRASLGAHGCEIAEAVDGKDAIRQCAAWQPDVVILDLGLPDRDGIDVLTEIREWSKVPIVVLSAREGEQDKIRALDAGATDYVTKPFGIGELLARLRRVVRDLAGFSPADAEGTIMVGPLEINAPERRVYIHGRPVKLTKKEYDLLLYLAQHAGKVLTHQQLLARAWGPAYVEQSHYLRIYIGNLRHKLGDNPEAPGLIHTEPGVGYRLFAGSDAGVPDPARQD